MTDTSVLEKESAYKKREDEAAKKGKKIPKNTQSSKLCTSNPFKRI